MYFGFNFCTYGISSRGLNSKKSVPKAIVLYFTSLGYLSRRRIVEVPDNQWTDQLDHEVDGGGCGQSVITGPTVPVHEEDGGGCGQSVSRSTCPREM
jgi:hypothetical protein